MNCGEMTCVEENLHTFGNSDIAKERMALLHHALLHLNAFCKAFGQLMLIIKALKEEGWALK